MEPTPTAFSTPGAVFAHLRQARGLSQYAIAKQAHVSADTVSKIESEGGEGMTLDTYRRLCHALGLSAQTVLDMLPPLPESAPIRGRGRPRKNTQTKSVNEA